MATNQLQGCAAHADHDDRHPDRGLPPHSRKKAECQQVHQPPTTTTRHRWVASSKTESATHASAAAKVSPVIYTSRRRTPSPAMISVLLWSNLTLTLLSAFNPTSILSSSPILSAHAQSSPTPASGGQAAVPRVRYSDLNAILTEAEKRVTARERAIKEMTSTSGKNLINQSASQKIN